MPSTRQLKTKIGAVKNIRQITKAVQMVSATKMRRSQETALNARPYAQKSMVLLLHLLKYVGKEELENSFWTGKKDNERSALVVITSDKGLAGSFNSSVLRKAWQWKNEQEKEGKEVDIVAVGRKGRDFFRSRNANIVREFLQFGDLIAFSDVRPLGEWILETYEKQTYGEITVCSNQFVSALVQKVGVHKILPLQIEELEKTIENIVPKTGKYSELAESEKKEGIKELSYVLEPSREIIIKNLIKNLILVEVMHFVFESNASEHSARMIAMKNATENAERLREELTLKLNKARQAAITQELTEISTAKEALTAE